MNNKLQDISKKSTDSIKRNLNVSKPTRQTYYQEIKQNSLIGNNSIPKQRIQTIIPELLNETTPQKDC